ncbi:MAG: VOC family protein [Actinophytocola sp.]|uniref:VOC family protein n=1 Tax=Actinophytocola sp. TaxID=1872138 RepID=UPI0013227AD6|nr:VOC family protein [Actinophytocola sp.]MPZ86146.1 VOC family protein [Actinophytocola sp.]
MVFKIQHITVDSHAPYALAEFWSVVTGWPVSDQDEPGSPEVAVEPPDRALPELLFVTVPETKTVKNRLHLDLVPLTGTRDEEVDRLLAAGATLVDDRRTANGRGWVVLADPEGNEFCVEASLAERG